ncbi:hypothetical protein F4808DRAFT_455453 [Astrocystis sublimbata]|nr:hypothetical protein F4808DRAFT_455453 [Astrocystis sublimbata]
MAAAYAESRAAAAAATAATANVSIATVDDIPDLIKIFWEAFRGPAESTFPQTEGGRMWLERSFQNFLGQQSYYRPESRVPIVRGSNGKPVSFAIVHVVKPGQTVVGSSWKRRWSRGDDLPTVHEDRLASFFEPLAKAHHMGIGREGHVYIEFLITKANQRHKGYATALINWVTKFADDLSFACYLDGGGMGMGILERAGFAQKDLTHKYKDSPPPCAPMLRPKRG